MIDPRQWLKRAGHGLLLAVTLLFLQLSCLPAWAQTPTGGTTPPPPVSSSSGSSGSYVNSAQTMLINISQSIPNLMQLVTAFAYVMGMVLVIRGIIKLKHMGEMRTQMSMEHSAMGPIILITIGALLIYLPSTVQMGLSTFWVEPNPYGYMEYHSQWTDFLNVCFLIIQFVGTIAFIRGLMILSHLGGGHGQQGSFAKGLTHIIGGILCINIFQLVQVLAVTLGINI